MTHTNVLCVCVCQLHSSRISERMCQYVLSSVGVRSISGLAIILFLRTSVVVSYFLDLTGQLEEVAGQSEV